MSPISMAWLGLLAIICLTHAHAKWKSEDSSQEFAKLLFALVPSSSGHRHSKVTSRQLPRMAETLKKPQNPYMLYMASRRDAVIPELKAKLGGDFTIGQVSKLIGAEWRGMSAAKKKPFEKQAAADKKSYEEAIAANPDLAPVSKSKKAAKTKGIKRPTNAYMFYMASRREAVTPELKAKLGSDFNIGQVSATIGEEWRGMSAAKKKPFEQQAAADKKRYEDAIAANPDLASPSKQKAAAKTNRIKRPTNAYMLYMASRREAVTPELKAKLGSDFKIGEVAKAIGAEWKGLSAAEKNPFQQQADADKKRYQDEMAADR